jgi:hypothetical protein
MTARQRKARPAHHHRACCEPADHQVTSSQGAYAAHTELALRVAWLRVHADLLYDVDEGGLLSAQLRDLADLLEALDGARRVVS